MYVVLRLAILALAILLLEFVGYTSLRDALAPTRRVMARVARKQVREWGTDLPGCSFFIFRIVSWLGTHPFQSSPRIDPGNSGRSVGFTHFIVTFSFENRTQDFVVSEETYIRANEGDTGLLVCKGERFLHFIQMWEGSPQVDA